jgi:acyl carrier protein
MTPESIQTSIAEAVARIASIATPSPEIDIYLAGFASTDALELLVELEETFGIVVRDDRFIESRTVAALGQLVQDALKEAA